MLTDAKKQQLVIDSEKWWEHTLERPLMQVTLSKDVYGEDSYGLSRGRLLEILYDPTVAPRDVAKLYRKDLENKEYYGDAFPVFYMRSTGILGAMLGQGFNIDMEHGTVWFEELEGKELEDIHPVLDSNNWLYVRGKELIEAFENEFKDEIGIGIPNLGGMMDIVESMRGANNSLMDLYDDPEEVIRLNDDIYAAYKKAYDEYIKNINNDKILGYSGWITLLSQKPYFISQCDFCCMIGPAQFDEFVYDTLEKEANLIERSFYHLDGPGAVKHLDRIIEAGFDGIQWINGAGSKPLDDPRWDDIYKKVHKAGKLLQVYIYNQNELKYIDHIVNLLGTTKGLAFICVGKKEEKIAYLEYLEKYNVPL